MIRYALNNVRRNTHRSLLCAIAISIATLVVIIAEGWIAGTLTAYSNGSARLQTGHIRITTAEYANRERFLPVDSLVSGAAALRQRILQLEGVASVEERLRFRILLGSGNRTQPAVGMGIEFGHSTLGIEEGIRRSRKPFRPDAIYPGKTLAVKLHVREGERLLLAAKTASGGLNGIKLPMAAAVATGSGTMDRNAFFISLSNARRLLRSGDAAAELYVYLHDPARAAAIAARIRPLLPAGAVARTLAEQNPAFHDYLTAVQSFMVLIDAVILFLASFVIINTMMMAVYERAREIGTLKALGMEEGAIIRSFGLEGGLLGISGGLAGCGIGCILIAVLQRTGIDLSAMMEGIDMPMEYIIRPSLSVGTVLVSLLLATVIPAGAAMLPASRIRRLSAAEALRRV